MQEKINFGVTQPYNDLFLTAFIWEVVLTFFLMLVIVAVATDIRAVGQLAGFSIGATILLEALVTGGVSGASMNPARSIAPALISGNFSHLLAYILGPIFGAIAAVAFYSYIRCDSSKNDKKVSGCC